MEDNAAVVIANGGLAWPPANLIVAMRRGPITYSRLMKPRDVSYIFLGSTARK